MCNKAKQYKAAKKWYEVLIGQRQFVLKDKLTEDASNPKQFKSITVLRERQEGFGGFDSGVQWLQNTILEVLGC